MATHYSKTALQSVCSGRPGQSPAVVNAFIQACGEDPEDWQRYIDAAAAGAPRLPGQDPPPTAVGDDGVPRANPAPRPRRHWLIAAALAAAAAIIFGLIEWISSGQHDPPPPTTAVGAASPPGGTTNGAVAGASRAAPISTPPATTHVEQGFAHNGAPTFATVEGGGPTGPRVPFGAKVEVLCKVYAPTMASVFPDGYWYLLGGQWDGKFYAAANTFLNGDSPTAKTFTHNTDMSVPDC